MTGSAKAAWGALVGRRDQPTDALRDYCEFLGAALGKRGIRLAVAESQWAERGWVRAWLELRRLARQWKDRPVLLQYTALSWSRRGIPLGAVALAAALRKNGARLVAVFHDWAPYEGSRVVDRIRRGCQLWTMRRLVALAERSIFPVPIEGVFWLRAAEKAAFIPIGANLSSLAERTSGSDAEGRSSNASRGRTVAVYGVTGGEPGAGEVQAIARAMEKVAALLPGVRLVVFGRGSEERRLALEHALNGTGVELSVLGLLPAEAIARTLSGADAMLFVRGELLGQRGSAIAAIDCGVPIVGYGDAKCAFPLSEAGIVFVPPGNAGRLGEALERVLTDDKLRLDLRERSRRAHAEYFSWDRIADRFVELLARD